MMLAMVGLFVPIVREMKELAYEFEEPYVVDDSRFRTNFDTRTTPLDEAVATTVAWHRQHLARSPKS
jgi:nucleoside-diphosphate-sugar epimerase